MKSFRDGAKKDAVFRDENHVCRPSARLPDNVLGISPGFFVQQ